MIGATHIRPVPAVISVVVKQGHVLLVRRANEPDAGKWGFPGGKIEPGETIAEAACRELFEETATRVKAGPVLSALDALDYDNNGKLRHHHVLIPVLCKWLEGVPVAGDDALDAGWVAVRDLERSGLDLSKDVARLASLACDRVGEDQDFAD